MYLLAFYCFLRIGEFTASKDRNCHLLTVQSLQFSKNISDYSIGFELTMKHFKKGQSYTLYVESNVKDNTICPVQALWTYFQVRKPTSGPFFTFMDGSPVSWKYFTDQLCLSFNWCSLDCNRYKGRSFRIGAATTAFSKGVPDQKIEAKGRCSSGAFKKYIRVPVVKLSC